MWESPGADLYGNFLGVQSNNGDFRYIERHKTIRSSGKKLSERGGGEYRGACRFRLGIKGYSRGGLEIMNPMTSPRLRVWEWGVHYRSLLSTYNRGDVSV